MGNDTSKILKNKLNTDKSEKSKPKLSEKTIEYICNETNQTRSYIEELVENFFDETNKDYLDKKDFKRLYCSLRAEPEDKLSKIADFVFSAFDRDRDEHLSLEDFIIGYAITSHGDRKKKLEYAFYLYDTDNKGYLNKNELKQVLEAMFHLLDIQKQYDFDKICDVALKELDIAKDGRISKKEFIMGLSINEELRLMMSPFD